MHEDLKEKYEIQTEFMRELYKYLKTKDYYSGMLHSKTTISGYVHGFHPDPG